MTENIQQIFMIQYGGSREFKQPDNLSNTSELEQKQKVRLVSRQIQSQEESHGDNAMDDEFQQTPIHRYHNNHHHPNGAGDSSQGSEADESSRQQLERTKVVLQFKITELQKICSTLTSANSKLLDKIEELQGENERLKERSGEGKGDGKRIVNDNNNGNNDNHNESSNDNQSNNNSQQSSIIIFDPTTNPNPQPPQSSSISSTSSQPQPQSTTNLINQQYQSQSIFQNQVSDIQQMIIQYRQQLKKAQELNKNNKLYYQGRIKELEESVNVLRQEVERYGQVNVELEGRLREMEGRNQVLEERNSLFEEEFEQLQHQTTRATVIGGNINSPNPTHSTRPNHHPIVANIKHHNPIPLNPDPTTPRSSFYNPYNPKRSAYNSTSSIIDDDFLYSQSISSTLQLQLQKLIEKLVKELENERGTKSKMGQELKRIQGELLEAEKVVSQRNQRIYQLEMQVLNYEKSNIIMSGNTSSNNININKPITIKSPTTATTSHLNNNPTTSITTTNTKSQYMLNANNNIRFASNITNVNSSNTNNSNSVGSINTTNVNSNPSPPPPPQRVNRQIFSRKEYVPSSGNKNNYNNNTNSNSKEVISQRVATQHYSSKGEQQQQQQGPSKQILSGQQQQSNSSITKATLNRQPTLKQLPTTTFTLTKQSQTPTSTSHKKLLQTCTLMQLLHNPSITLTQKQKLFISLKLILFYQQKIYKHRNYTLLALENILVTNFNQINLRLVIIRATTASDTQCYQADRIERLVENLAFLLNSILVDVQSGKVVENQGEGGTMLREKIQCILSGESVKEGDIGELRALVEAALE